MRLRFFITIFIVLALTAASVSAIHFRFFQQERIRLMELNLQQNATLLAESDLSLTKKEFSTIGQDFISDVIGDDKVNMIVAIYNEKGKVLYKNDNGVIFELPDSIETNSPQWEDVEYNEYFIKYLTQFDPKNRRIIKVGMILNQSLLRWKDLNQRIFLFVGILLFVITIISFFLTYLLFRPVRALANEVNLMGEKIESGDYAELKSWFQRLGSKNKRNDEFSSLLSSLDRLAHKITETQSMTQRWSALMAHELKTPMTRLRMSIDELTSKVEVPEANLKSVEGELRKLEDIIMDFLEWASLENDSSKPIIHAINFSKRTEDYLTYFKRTYPGLNVTLENKTQSDLRIFCNPIHFDQVLSNLLSNFAKYGGNEIKIFCEASRLTFKDNGPGIPEKVINNFGKPFNKYTHEGIQGHGLGLAWVNTIANKYNWKIHIDNKAGTKIDILFPQT